MIKRVLDIILSFTGLFLSSPFLVVTIFLIWKSDKKNPFYVTKRMGKNHKLFKMVKLRSMIVNADISGVFPQETMTQELHIGKNKEI